MISQQTPMETITLTATDDAGSVRRYKLRPDQGVFVGSSANCGLQLLDEGVADIQCRVGFEDGDLSLQTWISAEGTLVNGEPIATRTVLQLGDTIQIGRHRILLESSPQDGNVAKQDADQVGDSRLENHATECGPVPSSIGVLDAPAQHEELQSQDELDDHAPSSDDSLARLADEDEAIDLTNSFFDFEEEETYDRETVALLRAEIEELQSALAQRDADQFADRDEAAPGSDTDASADQPDKVLARMQELINEANRSDERVALLEEMLHASEAAKRSEQDERSQLEAWVGDIEKRIGQREEEHSAEIEALRNRLEQANLQEERLQRRMQQAAFGGNAPKQYEETLQNLQSTIKELHEKLAASEKSRLALEQKLDELSGAQDRAIREERAELAKERAKVSRLRYELSSKLTDIEELPKEENESDREIARRIQTLREHLREIHEQEKIAEKQAPLTTRLAKLWKRIEY